MHSKSASTISLVLGLLALAIALTAGAIIALDVAYPAMKSAPGSPSNLSEIVRNSTTLEELRKWCGHWASFEDHRSLLWHGVHAQNEQLLNLIVLGMLVWGLVWGIGCMFIYMSLRRVRGPQ